MALISSAATTELSTPPESAKGQLLVADHLFGLGDLLVDEGLSELGGGDAYHVVRALVGIHASFPFGSSRCGDRVALMSGSIMPLFGAYVRGQ